MPQQTFVSSPALENIDWRRTGTQQIDFQTTRVTLDQNEDGTFRFAWEDRIDKPKVFSQGSAVAAQMCKLASCLGDCAESLAQRTAFTERLQHLSIDEVRTCLTTVGGWYVNSARLEELPSVERSSVPTKG